MIRRRSYSTVNWVRIPTFFSGGFIFAVFNFVWKRSLGPVRAYVMDSESITSRPPVTYNFINVQRQHTCTSAPGAGNNKAHLNIGCPSYDRVLAQMSNDQPTILAPASLHSQAHIARSILCNYIVLLITFDFFPNRTEPNRTEPNQTNSISVRPISPNGTCLCVPSMLKNNVICK